MQLKLASAVLAAGTVMAGCGSGASPGLQPMPAQQASKADGPQPDVASLFRSGNSWTLDYTLWSSGAPDPSTPEDQDEDIEPAAVWSSPVTCTVTGVRTVETAWVSAVNCVAAKPIPQRFAHAERPAPAFTDVFVATGGSFWIVAGEGIDDEAVLQLLETPPLLTLPIGQRKSAGGSFRAQRSSSDRWCFVDETAVLRQLCVHRERGIDERMRDAEPFMHQWMGP